MPSKDRKTRLQEQRQWYHDHLKQFGNAPRREHLRAWVRTWKHLRPCADCGEAYPWWVMKYDDGSGRKDAWINQLVHRKVRFGAIMAAIDACDVVCANCFADREHRRRGSAGGTRLMVDIDGGSRWERDDSGRWFIVMGSAPDKPAERPNLAGRAARR